VLKYFRRNLKGVNMKKVSAVLLILSIAGVCFSASLKRRMNWVYKIKKTNPGTRSEGRIGKLFYKNKRVGYYFKVILTPVGQYRFTWSRYLWGSKGYFKTSGQTSDRLKASEKINVIRLKKIVKKGYYKGKSKYKNIPASWIRVKRKGNYYWLNPDKISMFIRIKKLRTLIHSFGNVKPVRPGIKFKLKKQKD
jgi:hypothetical protein